MHAVILVLQLHISINMLQYSIQTVSISQNCYYYLKWHPYTKYHVILSMQFQFIEYAAKQLLCCTYAAAYCCNQISAFRSYLKLFLNTTESFYT